MKIEVLTPVHIGSGDKYLALDYVIRGDRVVFIDSIKFFSEVEKKGLDPVEVARDVGSGGKSVEDYIDTSRIKLKELRFVGKIKRNEILMHIKSLGNSYIPGSSIKGAVRTAILWKEVKEDRGLLELAIREIKSTISNYERKEKKKMIPKKELNRLDDKLEKEVFRKAKLVYKEDDPKNDLLRALRVYDSDSFKTSVYQINFLGMKNFSILAECIDPEQIADIEMDIDDFILQHLNQRFDFDYITTATREFAEEIVKTEIKRGYPEEAKREFKNVLKAKGAVLRVGWGSGWYSSTIGTLLKTHPEFESIRRKLGLGRNPRTGRFSKNFPLIRRVTFDNKPLGWITLYE